MQDIIDFKPVISLINEQQQFLIIFLLKACHMILHDKSSYRQCSLSSCDFPRSFILSEHSGNVLIEHFETISVKIA